MLLAKSARNFVKKTACNDFSPIRSLPRSWSGRRATCKAENMQEKGRGSARFLTERRGQRSRISGMMIRRGRFMTPDPVGGGDLEEPGSWNRYAYVGGDPVSFGDPAGTCKAQAGTDVCFEVESTAAAPRDPGPLMPGLVDLWFNQFFNPGPNSRNLPMPERAPEEGGGGTYSGGLSREGVSPKTGTNISTKTCSGSARLLQAYDW